ncbi:hypothetical protein [Erwinia sp. 198]|uniref:hypothetical protein n=1 Tax=Erwinia sp. 198 TaxID=2022746 RepID=UPI000F675CED|nr:hypothetical protein [Erwinia sp. 198]RRZ93731.1 hypothetical protein EGK14_08025 [Erwinia sp. 198]
MPFNLFGTSSGASHRTRHDAKVMLPEQQSVLQWTRKPFILLEPHQLLVLFERFIAQAESMQRFLTLPAKSTS